MGGNPTGRFDRLCAINKGKLNWRYPRYAQSNFQVRYVTLNHTGNKKDNVTVIYTPWSNLRKDGSMAVGQVSFKDPKKVSFKHSSLCYASSGWTCVCWCQVKKILVPQRENGIVNRLNKTKVEKFPDLQMEKEERLKALRKRDQAAQLERVRYPFEKHISLYLLIAYRERKRLESRRRGRKRSGRKNMHMTISSRKKTWSSQVTKIGAKISWMTSCSFHLEQKRFQTPSKVLFWDLWKLNECGSDRTELAKSRCAIRVESSDYTFPF